MCVCVHTLSHREDLAYVIRKADKSQGLQQQAGDLEC